MTLLGGDGTLEPALAVVGDLPLLLLELCNVLLKLCLVEVVEECVLEDGVFLGDGHPDGELLSCRQRAETDDPVIVPFKVIGEEFPVQELALLVPEGTVPQVHLPLILGLEEEVDGIIGQRLERHALHGRVS